MKKAVRVSGKRMPDMRRRAYPEKRSAGHQYGPAVISRAALMK